MLIGITGTMGAGKGTIVKYLLEKGYKHYSVRNYLTGILESKGLPVTRDHTTPLANGLREEYGGGYIIEQLFIQAQKQGSNAVIESIRAIDEVDVIKKYNGLLLGINANQSIRYERTIQRNSSTDNISFEKFVENEYIEGSSPDTAKSNIFACLPLCDQLFINQSSIIQLYSQLDDYFAGLNGTS